MSLPQFSGSPAVCVHPPAFGWPHERSLLARRGLLFTLCVASHIGVDRKTLYRKLGRRHPAVTASPEYKDDA